MSQPPPNPSSSSSAPQFQTDARFRTSLPTASLKSSITVPQVDSETYLQNHEEEWNRLVDAEVESLAEGMADLVGIASVSSGRLERGVKIINEILKIEGKDRFQIAQEAFQAECKAESMAIAANSLLSITHSLKLMFLLGDEEYITQRRQERLKTAVADITAAKARFEKAWDGLKEPRALASKELAQQDEQENKKGGADTKA
ncbi:unnamed protein product [Rhizoctonia solani]|uniref:Surfeit locus protein 5 subunit 22 of Mediator complex n=1 Tax=Rhizoctonia solani TaxID=456999 RepID=A0A8H7H1Z3_9AGAM|nr:Surfeit locus protein 5 subunit 22 of Mediator complex [Rhizoctonia solani]CAE6432058.1 unnamed protein product [Rhizoctonia solani]